MGNLDVSMKGGPKVGWSCWRLPLLIRTPRRHQKELRIRSRMRRFQNQMHHPGARSEERLWVVESPRQTLPFNYWDCR